MTSRRALVLGLGAAALGGGLATFWSRRTPAFDFQPLQSVPGFRRIARGQTSGSLDVFAGLGSDGVGDAQLAIRARDLGQDPCPALFFKGVLADRVPVASFSDYSCPYCRILTAQLRAIETTGRTPITVTWHELPLLGPTSQIAAKAALAADAQGAYAEFHQRLMRTKFVPNSSYLRVLAHDLNINANRLIADMEGAVVGGRITNALALARVFGIPGTPALVVGRTLVIGQIAPTRLKALIAEEAKSGTHPCA